MMPEKNKNLRVSQTFRGGVFSRRESASLAGLIHRRWNDSGADRVMALTTFIPLRLIRMRTVGVSAFGAITFIAAAVMGVISIVCR